MSLEIVAKLICDNCRAEIIGKMCSRSTRSGESYWDAKSTADKHGWLTVSRGRYRIPAHYCKDCADKPVAKLKDPPRKPKCKRCKGRGSVPINKGTPQGFWIVRDICPECNGTGKPKTHNGLSASTPNVGAKARA